LRIEKILQFGHSIKKRKKKTTGQVKCKRISVFKNKKKKKKERKKERKQTNKEKKAFFSILFLGHIA